MIKRIILFSFVGLALFYGCSRDLPTYQAYESFSFSKSDPEGGTWKPILLTSGSEILIDQPQEITSPEYLEEVSRVKVEQSKMSDEDRTQVSYWSNNPVIRWNEITLGLIAKYNLIPGPNDDDSYTLPSASNPDGKSKFPFAHPPYAVRALSYLSVAQYDGMVAACYQQYKHKRFGPSTVDNTIQQFYQDNEIPSYPSDGAVIAAASRKVLSAMFPLEAEYLLNLQKLHLKSLLHSGAHVESDILAGIKIGEYIADLALKRATGDGMNKAQVSKSVSDSIAKAGKDNFGWEWKNLEIPARPVGLAPFFGNVKPWAMSDVKLFRSEPPVAIGSDEFIKDIALLKDYADNVTPERRRIANFWQDGIGTYTPPGHWNYFATQLIIKYKINPIRSARIYAYLNMAMTDAGIACWDTKYYYYYPRPIQMIDGFKTILGTPNFPAYSSGHSVFSSAGAEILGFIFPEERVLLRSWAREAALSRLYGGIHWSWDASAGTAQGAKVADVFIDIAAKDGAD